MSNNDVPRRTLRFTPDEKGTAKESRIRAGLARVAQVVSELPEKLFKPDHFLGHTLKAHAEAASNGNQLVLVSAPASEVPTRPRLEINRIAIEDFDWDQIKDLFVRGAEPEEFNPKKTYTIQNYTPPKDTKLYFLLHRLADALGQTVPPGIQLLQRKEAVEENEAKEVPERTFITSCVWLHKPTPWLEITPVSMAIEKFGVKIRKGEIDPVIVRLLPAEKENNLFETGVVFRDDPFQRRVPLSRLVALTALSKDSVLGPLSPRAKNYLAVAGDDALVAHVERARDQKTGEELQALSAPRPKRPRAPKAVVPPPSIAKAMAATPVETPVPPVSPSDAASQNEGRPTSSLN